MPFEASSPAALNERTLRRWLDSYFDFVARVLRSAGTPAAELDDAVQRTFIVAARRQNDVRAGSERGFLLQIALNVAAHARRSAARRREVPVSELPERADCDTPERLASLHRDRQLLGRIIAELPPDLRTVFVQAELEERTMAEIARSLAIPPGTVASRLRRARELCRERLRGLVGCALLLGEILRAARAEAKALVAAGGKTVLAVVGAGALAAPLALSALQQDQAPPPTAPAAVAAAVAAGPAAKVPGVPTTAAPPVQVPAPAAQQPARTAPATVAVAPPAKPASSAEELRVELSRLDAVRRELALGRPQQALVLLDQYARASPRGALRLEAEVLRIDALSRSGRQAQAQARARSFLARHPNSVLGARVRRIAGG
jgi:RNA polymerase sigma-70 factor (ECF subfamily)